VVLAIGIGLGRIKNASKLAAIHNYLVAAETAVTVDVKKVIADIKAKL
jgi:hypothetical protein